MINLRNSRVILKETPPKTTVAEKSNEIEMVEISNNRLEFFPKSCDIHVPEIKMDFQSKGQRQIEEYNTPIKERPRSPSSPVVGITKSIQYEEESIEEDIGSQCEIVRELESESSNSVTQTKEIVSDLLKNFNDSKVAVSFTDLMNIKTLKHNPLAVLEIIKFINKKAQDYNWQFSINNVEEIGQHLTFEIKITSNDTNQPRSKVFKFVYDGMQPELVSNLYAKYLRELVKNIDKNLNRMTTTFDRAISQSMREKDIIDKGVRREQKTEKLNKITISPEDNITLDVSQGLINDNLYHLYTNEQRKSENPDKTILDSPERRVKFKDFTPQIKQERFSNNGVIFQKTQMEKVLNNFISEIDNNNLKGTVKILPPSDFGHPQLYKHVLKIIVNALNNKNFSPVNFKQSAEGFNIFATNNKGNEITLYCYKPSFLPDYLDEKVKEFTIKSTQPILNAINQQLSETLQELSTNNNSSIVQTIDKISDEIKKKMVDNLYVTELGEYGTLPSDSPLKQRFEMI